jgi:hypothetical protein
MLWWQHEQPEEYARIAKFLTPAAYVAGRMAGLRADRAFMDYTFIHFSGVCDNRAGTWSAAICDTLGVDMSRLPEIVGRGSSRVTERGDRAGRGRHRRRLTLARAHHRRRNRRRTAGYFAHLRGRHHPPRPVDVRSMSRPVEPAGPIARAGRRCGGS